MNHRFLSVILAILFCSPLVFAQDTKIAKSHDVFNDYNPNLVVPSYVYYPPVFDNPLYTNVDISANTAPQNEPSVKISRKNPNRVLAAWRDFRIGTNPAVRRVGYSYSTDFGATWAPSMLIDSTLLPGLLRNSDASVTVDTAGNFYITTIALNNTNGNTTLAIYKSTDGGLTFPNGMILAQGQSEDKEMVTSDLSPNSPYRNNIYISWSRLNASSDIQLIRSTNAGATFGSPALVSNAGTYGQGSDPAVGPNGEVYVTWVNTSWNTIYFNRSTNGGVSFGTPMTVASGTTPPIPFSQGGNGVTFPSIAVDISGGPRNGYVYITWCDGRNGDADIFLIRSSDGGTSWSAPLRVNNDALGNGKLQAWPWIAVNEQGKIAINYYDCRNTPSNSIVEAWLAYSTDGGVTFSNNVMSTQQSPTNQPNTDVRFGDYLGCDFVGNKIVPVWTDERAGGYDMSIYTAVVDITVGIQPVANQMPGSFGLAQNYPNPFNPQTSIGFNVPKASHVNIVIFDEAGRFVATFIDEQMNAGSYKATWDGTKYSSGVYFYKMTTSDGYIDTKKMILVK